MAYGFNDDKSKAEVLSRNDIVIVEDETFVAIRSGAENIVDITDRIDDADNYALISAQYYLDESPSGGYMEYVGKWISSGDYFLHNTSGYITDAKIFPEVYVYNDETNGHHVYAKYTVRNESDKNRMVKMRLVFMRIN